MSFQFDHIALNVEDIGASIEWYKKHLSAEVSYQDDTWAMLLIGTTRIALTIPSQHPPHLAFCVKMPELGENYRVHRDGSSYIYKTDPDGNTVELICWEAKDDTT